MASMLSSTAPDETKGMAILMTGTPHRKILVAGALGTVGCSALEHFATAPDCEVVGLSRRSPDFATDAAWHSVDLRDSRDCHAKLGTLRDITHIVYAAVHEKPDVTRGWSERDHADINLAMLRNLLSSVENASPNLRHVSLMQGTKAYGGHLGPFRMPARETDPRSMGPNFYYDQMDWLAAYQAGKDWTWTIFRPQLVCGPAIGSPLNIIAAIGAFAAISRHTGIPLRFPGGPDRIGEATDARLIARAVDWAGTAEIAAGQIYNIHNGDVYVWQTLWPRVAALFEMDTAPAQPMSLARIMPENADVWDRIVARHDLKPYRLDQIVPSWRFADFMFGYGQRPNPHHMSTIKIRKHGFVDCIDTEDMMLEHLRTLQAQHILPR